MQGISSAAPTDAAASPTGPGAGDRPIINSLYQTEFLQPANDIP